MYILDICVTAGSSMNVVMDGKGAAPYSTCKTSLASVVPLP
jgi:hypothetical protein